MDILVNVANQTIKLVTNLHSLVEGTQKFVRFVFDLSDEWDDLLVFAQFTQNGTSYNSYLDENNCVYLPPEITAGECTLMIYGSGETVIGTTNYLTLEINESILVSDAHSTEITESLYNQLVDYVEELDDRIDHIILEAGITEINEGDGIDVSSDGTERTVAIDPTIYSKITNAASKSYVDDEVGAKQDTLVSGTNIKTINNNSLLGSGNVDIVAGVSDVEVDGVSVVTEGVASVDLSSKQDTLVSGTNIKTVNNNSLLGSGDISIGMTILSYGSSTWSDFIAAYNTNRVIYCRASSGSNPASGSQTRLAFMAYVNNATSPTSVEFQYYRSINSHSDTQQGDQVYVYTLTSSGSWTVTVREAYTKINVSNGLSKSYSNGTLTISGESLSAATNWLNGSALGSVRTFGSAGENSSYTIGQYATSEGYHTKSSGVNSHAEGYQTEARADSSHAEGYFTKTIGNSSHAEGVLTTAYGECSHAEGDSTEAIGPQSHAGGRYTKAVGMDQVAIGRFNKEDPSAYVLTTDSTINPLKTYYIYEYGVFEKVDDPDVEEINSYYEYQPVNAEQALIIGNGNGDDDYEDRSNALTVDWSGNVDIASGAHYKINGNSMPESISLTRAQYDALTTAQKNNGNIYFVTDDDDVSDMLDSFYPVGSYYETGSSQFDPNISFGGTWSSETVTNDSIVEEGTDGIWTYRKWKSGVSECWGAQWKDCTVNVAWGSAYEAQWGYENYPSNLFSATPILQTTLKHNGAAAFIEISSGHSATRTPLIYIARPAVSNSSVSYGVGFHAIGMWKTITTPTTIYRWHRTA